MTMKPLQDNKITIDLKDFSSYAETFSVCESLELKLSHNPPIAAETLEKKKNAILKIVGKLGMPEKEKNIDLVVCLGLVFFMSFKNSPEPGFEAFFFASGLLPEEM